MPGEIQGLQVDLTIDSSGATQNAAKYSQALESTNSSTERALTNTEKLSKVLSASQQAYKNITQTVQKAVKGYQDEANGVKVTQQAYDKKVRQLEEYAQKLRTAISQEEALTAARDKLAASGTDWMSATKDQLSQYEKDIQKTIDEQLRWSEALDKTGAELEGMSAKTQDVSRSAVSMAASAGSAVAQLVGANGLAPAIQETGRAINVLQSTANAGGNMLFAGLTAGVGVAIAAVSALVNSVKQAKEESNEAFQAMQQAATDYGNNAAQQAAEIQQLERNYKIINDVASSTDELKKARDGIISQFPSLKIGEIENGDAILASNAAIERQIELEKERLRIQRDTILRTSAFDATRVEEDIAKNTREYEKQENKLTLLKEAYDFLSGAIDGATVSQEAMLKYGSLSLQELDQEINRVRASLEELDTAISIEGPSSLFGILQAEADRALESVEGLSEGARQIATQEVNERVAGLAEAIRKGDMAMGEARMMMELYFRQLDQGRISVLNATAAENELAEAREKALRDAKKEYGDLTNATNALAKANEANQRALDAGQMKKYLEVVKAGKTDTDEYKQALEAVRKVYGPLADDIMMNIGLMEMLNQTEIDAAQSGRTELANTIRDTIIPSLDALSEAGALAISILQGLEQSLRLPQEIKLPEIKTPKSSSSKKTKSAWELEVEMIERAVRSADEYPDAYEQALRKTLESSKLNAKERRRVEEELSLILMAKNDELADHQIATLEKILKNQKLTADQRISVEQKLFDALVAQRERLIEKEKELQEEQKRLMEQQIQDYQQLGDAVVSALRNQYQQQADAATAHFDAQIAQAKAAADAQKAAIAAQGEYMQAVINRQIDGLNQQIKRLDETIKARNKDIDAINSEIKALDDLKKARDRLNKDEDDQAILARLRKQLSLERDVYDQQKIMEQIAAKEAEIAKRKEDEAFDDRKAQLQDQISVIRDEISSMREQQSTLRDTISIYREQASAIRESTQIQQRALEDSSAATIASLQAQQKAAQDYWSQRMKQETLEAEALKFLQEKTQEEIIELLEKYYPEYLKAADLLGKAILETMSEKAQQTVQAVKKMTDDIQRQVEKAAAALAALQKQAASFTYNAPAAYMSSYGSGSGTNAMQPYSAGETPSGLENFVMALLDFPDTLARANQASLEAILAPARAQAAQTAQRRQTAYDPFQRATIDGGVTIIVQEPLKSQYDVEKAFEKGFNRAWRKGRR